MAEPYVNPAELPVKRRENIALGVLGALLFSAAGGLVHFGLLQLGYIAWISALVGMAAGYFGYGLFSGRKNTVHGAILAVVFRLLRTRSFAVSMEPYFASGFTPLKRTPRSRSRRSASA